MEFYLVRFLLGLAEAGFFPGMILFFTYWFPPIHRGRITAGFMTAIPISIALAARFRPACSNCTARSALPAGNGFICWKQPRRFCSASSA